MQCASSMATKQGLRLASISGNPLTRSRSGAMKRKSSFPSRYCTQTSREAARSRFEWMRSAANPNAFSFPTWSSINAIRGLLSSRSTPHFTHHFAHVLLDALEERYQLRLPALDALEVGFPLSSHRWTLHLGVNHFDQADALVGRLEALASPRDKSTLQQHLD